MCSQNCVGTLVVPAWPSAAFWPILWQKYQNQILAYKYYKGNEACTHDRNSKSTIGSSDWNGYIIAQDYLLYRSRVCNTVKINVKGINQNRSTVVKKKYHRNKGNDPFDRVNMQPSFSLAKKNKTKNRWARQSQIDGSESDRKLLRLRIVYHKTTSRWALQSRIDGSERDRKLLRLRIIYNKKTSR